MGYLLYQLVQDFVHQLYCKWQHTCQNILQEEYPSFHNPESEKWVPPIVVTFQIRPFYAFIIMGESVSG